jgi:hypothetical protein
MDAPEPLKPLNENWTKGMAIVAHPDDMEFGSAAAVARWTGQDKEIVYVMVTSGEAGVASLAAHKAYIDGLGWENFDSREFLEGFGRQIGQRLGTTFGAIFGVYPMTWEQDDD